MTRKHDRPPELLNVNGVVHKRVLLRIETFDEDGRPESLTLIPDDRMIELSQDQDKNQFVTCYVPRHMILKRSRDGKAD